MKKIIYSVVFLFLINLSANAYVDSQFTSSEQFLINSGYSKEASRLLQIQKKDLYGPVDNKTNKQTIYQKIYSYIDPLYTKNSDFAQHNIQYDKSDSFSEDL